MTMVLRNCLTFILIFSLHQPIVSEGIVLEPGSQAVHEGDTTQFRCQWRVFGYELLRWSKDGMSLGDSNSPQADQRYRVLRSTSTLTSKLEIVSTRPSDEATYTCTASDGGIGMLNISARLIVIPRPKCVHPWRLYRPEKSCLLVHSYPMNHRMAMRSCSNMGGGLVKISNPEKERFVRDLLAGSTTVYWMNSPLKMDWSMNGYIPGNLDHYCVAFVRFTSGHFIRRDCADRFLFACEKLLRYSGPDCQENWLYYHRENVCIHVPQNQYKSWIDSRTFCQDLGGDLVSIWNDEKRHFILDRFTQDQYLWIGISDRDNDGIWTYVGGAKLHLIAPNASVQWSPGDQIAGLETDRCITLDRNLRGFRRMACGYRTYFLCEKHAEYSQQSRSGYRCTAPWQVFDVHSCVRMVFRQMTWAAARDYCVRRGGDLAQIGYHEQKERLREMIPNSYKRYRYWLGIASVEVWTGSSLGTSGELNILQYANGTRFTFQRPVYPHWANLHLWRHYNRTQGCLYFHAYYKQFGWSPTCSGGSGFVCERLHYRTFRSKSYECGPGRILYNDDDQETSSFNPYPCIKVFNMPKSYMEARAFCRSHGSGLVEIPTPKAEAQIKELTDNHSTYWIKYASSRHWKFYFDFNRRLTPGHCLTLKNDDFFPVNCSFRRHFICEKLPVGEGGENGTVCPSGWIWYFRENVCVMVFRTGKSWILAKNFCIQRHGGSLVAVWNKEKQYFLADLTLTQFRRSYWLGMFVDHYYQVRYLTETILQWHPAPVSHSVNIPYDFENPEYSNVVTGREEHACVGLAKGTRGLQRMSCSNMNAYICEMRGTNNCSRGWAFYDTGKSCIKSINGQPETFHNAGAACIAQNATLVQLWERQKMNFVRRFRGSAAFHWVGIHDPSKNGSLVFIEGGAVPHAKVEFPPYSTAYLTVRSGSLMNFSPNEGCYFKDDFGSKWSTECGLDVKRNFICTYRNEGVGRICPDGWSKDTLDQFCFKSFDVARTWRGAMEFCLNRGGYLVNIPSHGLEKDVKDTPPSPQYVYWIGSYQPLRVWTMKMTIHGSGECMSMGPDLFVRENCDDRKYSVCEKRADPAMNCQPGWEFYSRELVCLKLYRSQETYENAESVCNGHDAKLVSIWNKNKQYFIYDAISVPVGTVWVGLKYDNSGGWEYPDGTHFNPEPIEPTPWNPAKMFRGPVTHHCVALNYENEGFADVDCDLPLPFICEARLGNQTECPNHWVYSEIENTCVGIPADLTKGWYFADQVCEEMGANLFNVGTPSKIALIAGLQHYDQSLQHWIGIYHKGGEQMAYLNGTVFIIKTPEHPSWSDPNLAQGMEMGACYFLQAQDRRIEWDMDCQRRERFICQKLSLARNTTYTTAVMPDDHL